MDRQAPWTRHREKAIAPLVAPKKKKAGNMTFAAQTSLCSPRRNSRLRLLTSPPAQRRENGLVLGSSAFAARCLAQVLIEIGVVHLHVVDDLEVLLLDPGEVDALDVDQAQQVAHGLGHRTAAFVARAAALRDADHGPEFLLVHAEASADFPRIDQVEKLHLRLRYLPKLDDVMPTAWSVPASGKGAAGRGAPLTSRAILR